MNNNKSKGSLKLLFKRLIIRKVHNSKNFINEKIKMVNDREFTIFRNIKIISNNDMDKSAAVFKVQFKFLKFPAFINKKLSFIPTPFLIAKPGFLQKIWCISSDGYF